MIWMAGRSTTRAEDIAYSMLGLLGVSMTIQYGEGPAAFHRLQPAILERTRFDESLFAWRCPPDRHLLSMGRQMPLGLQDSWGILAPSPDCFDLSGKVVPRVLLQRRGGAFRWSYDGMLFDAHPLPPHSGWNGKHKKAFDVQLNCGWPSSTGSRSPHFEAVVLRFIKSGDRYRRVLCTQTRPGIAVLPLTRSLQASLDILEA